MKEKDKSRKEKIKSTIAMTETIKRN